TSVIYLLSLHDALPIFDQVELGLRRGRAGPGLEVAQVEVEQVIVQRRDRALVDLGRDVAVEPLSQGVGGLDDRIAPVVLLEHERSEEHTSELQSRENLV